jgi:hypothetical protein
MAFMLKNRNSAFSVFAEESSGFLFVLRVLDSHAASQPAKDNRVYGAGDKNAVSTCG